MLIAAKNIYISLIVICAVLAFLTGPSFGADDWLAEFEDLCGKTEESGSMTKPEVKALIERCDKLKPIIQQSDNPQKNVYLFRLDKCKKLFIYVLEAE